MDIFFGTAKIFVLPTPHLRRENFRPPAPHLRPAALIGNTRNYLPPLDLRCPRPALREPTVVLRTSGVANLRCPRLARREPALTPLATPRAASSVPERPRPAHRELREAAARPARRCPSGRAPPTASCWRPQRSPRHAPPAGVRGTPCPPVPVAAPRPPRAAGGRSEARGAPRPPVPVRRCRWPRPAHRELKVGL